MLSGNITCILNNFEKNYLSSLNNTKDRTKTMFPYSQVFQGLQPVQCLEVIHGYISFTLGENNT